MSQLSEASLKLLKVVRDYPGQDGDQLRRQHLAGAPQTTNNIKLLEQHGYLEWDKSGMSHGGWYLTEKGKDVLKYG